MEKLDELNKLVSNHHNYQKVDYKELNEIAKIVSFYIAKYQLTEYTG